MCNVYDKLLFTVTVSCGLRAAGYTYAALDTPSPSPPPPPRTLSRAVLSRYQRNRAICGHTTRLFAVTNRQWVDDMKARPRANSRTISASFSRRQSYRVGGCLANVITPPSPVTSKCRTFPPGHFPPRSLIPLPSKCCNVSVKTTVMQTPIRDPVYFYSQEINSWLSTFYSRSLKFTDSGAIR